MAQIDWVALFTRFDGRIPRHQFWIGFLILLGAEIMVLTAAYAIEGDRLGAIVDLAFTYPEFALFLKRANDRGTSHWLVVGFFAMAVLMNFLVVLGWSGRMEDLSTPVSIILIPWVVLAIALFVDLGFRRGTVGPNQHGPDPL
jgi:uncharacterized membrane protein YhaH (DUF805 family)